MLIICLLLCLPLKDSDIACKYDNMVVWLLFMGSCALYVLYVQRVYIMYQHVPGKEKREKSCSDLPKTHYYDYFIVQCMYVMSNKVSSRNATA